MFCLYKVYLKKKYMFKQVIKFFEKFIYIYFFCFLVLDNVLVYNFVQSYEVLVKMGFKFCWIQI